MRVQRGERGRGRSVPRRQAGVPRHRRGRCRRARPRRWLAGARRRRARRGRRGGPCARRRTAGGRMTWLVVSVGLLLLVFLHELGHFTVALAVGMRPRSFYIGFPPALVKVKRKGIEYGIGVIPLGGLVKLPGMNRPAARDLRLQAEPAVREEPSLVPAVGALRRALEVENYEAARSACFELEQEVSAAELTPRARRSIEGALREVE